MAESARGNYPIVVMAFNRPDYLKEVLDSLLRQEGVDLAERNITLFQDGSYNEYSRAERANPADIAASVAVFRERFPTAKIEQSTANLGVALNFDRAERWVFEELAADAAIFLEDDMVLSPHYIRTIDRMLDMAMDDQRIGYVAAYGDWKFSIEKHRLAPGRVIPLWQNWAFGLTRHQWLKNQNFMEEYLPFVRGIDYRHRPHEKIFDLYSRYGMERAQSSQDRAKLIACALTGGVRINTFACLARYIGKVGLHSDEASYLGSGFERTVIYPDGDFKIEALTDESYQRLMKLELEHIAATSPWLDRNQPLSFAHGANGLRGLSNDFFPPEGWGVWAGTKHAVVSIQLATQTPPSLRQLWITAVHYTILPDQEVMVTVRGNGHLLGAILLRRPRQRVMVPLPEGVVGHEGNLELTFDSASICSPKDGGSSQDARLLGIGLIKFELE
jgi:hypothetical protein